MYACRNGVFEYQGVLGVSSVTSHGVLTNEKSIVEGITMLNLCDRFDVSWCYSRRERKPLRDDTDCGLAVSC